MKEEKREKKLTPRQIRKFVHIWNKKNGFSDGVCIQENMRYDKEDNRVYWNVHDSPEVDLDQMLKIFKDIK